MDIALLNVKYSPNLGDGLLSECLERELEACLPGSRVFSIDLAGRRVWASIGRSRRGDALRLLEALPAFARRLVAQIALAALVRLRLRRHFRDRLARCRAAVLGGGNLLTDADLNFPTKIAAALHEARRRRLPVAVHAVGAAACWSRRGRKLFAGALGSVRLVAAAVRDARSQAAWIGQLEPAGLPPAALVGDPGLLAARHYPAPSSAPPDPDLPLAGLCITAPLALRYHANAGRAQADLAQWYGDTARALAEAGLRVALFSNGSPEDREYLARMGPVWVRRACGPVTIVNPFPEPAALVGFLRGCDVVVAHRMHATIAAHALAVPTIGLRWDVKLDSFFALAGREDFVVDTATHDGPAMAILVQRALAQGVDRTALAALIERTRADVARMAKALALAAA